MLSLLACLQFEVKVTLKTNIQEVSDAVFAIGNEDTHRAAVMAMCDGSETEPTLEESEGFVVAVISKTYGVASSVELNKAKSGACALLPCCCLDIGCAFSIFQYFS